jgi:soluble lytic murein transglycosylase
MRKMFCALLLALQIAGCQLVQPTPPTAAPTPPETTAPPRTDPSSAPAPSEQLAQARELRVLGEYEAAAKLFLAVSQSGAQGEASEAAFYLAESYLLREQWEAAAGALQPIASGPADSPFSAHALFLLGRAQERLGDYTSAADSYARYTALATPIADYARFRQAEALLALQSPEQAAQAAALFEQVAASGIERGERALAFERAAAAHLAAGQPSEAQRVYTELLAFAEQPAYRAHVLLAAADAAAATGDQAQRRTWLAEIIAQSPDAPQALAAIHTLQAETPSALDPAQTAPILVAAEEFEAARSAYEAAIGNAAGEERIELMRRHALTFREGAAPDYAAALAALAEAQAEAQPGSDIERQIRLDTIQTIGQSGDIQTAIDSYHAFAAELPDDPRAPEALRRTALLLERLGDSAAALAQRREILATYPDSSQAAELIFPVGLTLYQQGDHTEAAALWELLAAQNESAAAQALYWAARARQDLGDPAAHALFERVIELAPSSYYAQRAAEQIGQPPTNTRPDAVPLGTPIDDADWTTLSDWIQRWAGEPASTAALEVQPSIQRAIALEGVRLDAEAVAEWRSAFPQIEADPQQLARVARLAYSHGQHGVALDAAIRILQLSPAEEQAAAPLTLDRLLYPAPYAPAILAAAQEQQIDPLTLYGLIWQESSFYPTVTSSAGARGLSQVMPATGAGLAQGVGITDFHEDDLFRPGLNIRLGARYLGVQLRDYGQLAAALSAYNAGPGNTARWAELPGASDQDLFVEQVDYGETRTYIKRVYAHIDYYRQIYRVPDA